MALFEADKRRNELTVITHVIFVIVVLVTFVCVGTILQSFIGVQVSYMLYWIGTWTKKIFTFLVFDSPSFLL